MIMMYNACQDFPFQGPRHTEYNICEAIREHTLAGLDGALVVTVHKTQTGL